MGTETYHLSPTLTHVSHFFPRHIWITDALAGHVNALPQIILKLSGIFLFPRSSGMRFQASLATFWGSWAFLISSVIQWYESLDKYPVEESSRR
jgi:hypothetical protein